MSYNIPGYMLKIPGVRHQRVINWGQLDPKLKKRVIQALKSGFPSQGVVRALGDYALAECDWPITGCGWPIMWYCSKIHVESRWFELLSSDVKSAAETCCVVLGLKPTTWANAYGGYYLYLPRNHAKRLITFENVPEWRELVDPVIERIERGDTLFKELV